MESSCGTLDITKVLLEHHRVLGQHLVNALVWIGVEQVDPCPLQANVLQPVTSEQGGSSTQDNEEFLMQVVIGNIHLNCTRNRDFLTCVSEELSRRGNEGGSSIPVPEPVVRLLAHDRLGCTRLYFHGGFIIAKSYRDFYRLGSLCCGVVEQVHSVLWFV